MSQSTVGKYVRLSYELFKMSLQNAMEYRVSFLVTVFGMVINDFCWLLAFYLLFQKFPNIGGWTFSEMYLLYAINTMAFGIIDTFAASTLDLGDQIVNGRLDFYLSYPKNVLWFVSSNKMYVSGIGDFICGLAILLMWPGLNVEHFFMALFLSLLAAAIYWGYRIMVYSLVFWFGDISEILQSFMWLIVTFSLYPQSIYKGAVRLVFYFIIPAFFVGFIPINIVLYYDLSSILLMIFGVVFFVGGGILMFYRGLRRYESGNLINVD